MTVGTLWERGFVSLRWGVLYWHDFYLHLGSSPTLEQARLVAP